MPDDDPLTEPAVVPRAGLAPARSAAQRVRAVAAPRGGLRAAA